MAVTGVDSGLNGIQLRTLLKLFQTMRSNLKATMTLLGKQFMMKNI